MWENVTSPFTFVTSVPLLTLDPHHETSAIFGGLTQRVFDHLMPRFPEVQHHYDLLQKNLTTLRRPYPDRGVSVP